jgi:glyoxylase-like metal-dependent hydrolase (beta-lactamase superfamily II)
VPSGERDPSRSGGDAAPAPRRRELARADRVRPGLWRLRLPLPWPAVPHVNAWAIAAGSGLVLVDCGLEEPGSLEQLDRALEQAGAGIEHVRLLVCTHAHPDHYGQAAAVRAAAGCELWMHGDHGHVTAAVADPERALSARLELMRASGAPVHLVDALGEQRRAARGGVGEALAPDREIASGARVETDLGGFEVHETPGHAPSHVVLHEPRHGLLVSGDHLLGRISLYYDFGYTPDPVGEFLGSLDRVDALDASLCLAGHGRPFRDVRAHVEGNRRRVAERLETVRSRLEAGPASPFECATSLLATAEPSPLLLNWGVTEALCYLTRLERLGRAERVERGDVGSWRLA